MATSTSKVDNADELTATNTPVDPPHTLTQTNFADNDTLESQNNELEQHQSSATIEEPYSIYSSWEKKALVLAASSTAFFSPLSAQIYLPALPVLSKDLHVTPSQINLTITTYMIFQGIVPMFFGALADSGGRRPAYIACFVIYIGANIGLALAPGYGAILGLRCLQSAGSSSTVALCSAVVADVVTSAERGKYIGYTVVSIVLAPSLGPVIGGLLSQSLGWRWIFWFLTIISSATLVLILVFLPETCRPIVGNGSITPPKIYQSFWQMMQLKKRQKARANDIERQVTTGSQTPRNFKFKMPNLLGSLLMLTEVETFHILIPSSIVFAGFYCLATAMPTEFQKNYGYNEIEVGLMYLPLAVGSIIAALVAGPAINWNYKRHCVKAGMPVQNSRQADLSNFPIEQARLEIGLPLLGLAAVCLISWGWVMQANVSPAGPAIISCLLGVGMIGFNNTTNALLIDIHLGKAGTATAANNVTRCLVGAGASAAVVPMINAMGVGWAFTLIGGIYVLCVPSLLLVQWRSIKWRKQKKEKDERKAAAKESKKNKEQADQTGQELDQEVGDEEVDEEKRAGERRTNGENNREKEEN